MKTTNINRVCTPCGITANYLTCLKKFGAPPIKATFQVSTFGISKCDVCGHKAETTEPRDFFYPDFTLLRKVKNIFNRHKAK